MLELRINNKTADISESSILAVTKMYESVTNPLRYYADWSKTVQLPVTPTNNAIFNNFNRLDSAITNISLDPTKKIPCMILSNQEPVLEGYCKLENANTIYTDEKYEITIYSTFGLIMNDLKLLTFNKNAVGIDQMYIINSPLSDDLTIDRNLVKRSFEQTIHRLDSDDVIDWIGFIPTYQGKYDDFSSDKEQLLPSGRTDDMSRERDEHYMREFRSYYQQPFIWVDKLWKVAKDKIESITDYSFNLDESWFNPSNPYYKDLIYTCPSLFNSDDNYRNSTENYADEMNVVMFNKPSKNPSLSTHQSYQLYNLNSTTNAIIYDPNTGIFNTNADFGSTKLKGRFKLTLFASIPGYTTDGYWYCKITDDNPFYVKIKAVNANTGQDIYGANKTFLIYSDDYDVNSGTFDEGIDVGVCNIAHTGVGGGNRPLINHTGYQLGNHAWECDLNFELNVPENVPYKVYFEVWNANNGDPFEYTSTFSGVYWDWLWGDDFNTTYGANNDKGYSMYFDTKNVSCETTENLRTGSNISLYRVFPKDVTLCDVLLNYSKMFGLVWDVNEYEKTVTVMTRNSFFSDYHIEDWTDRIDRSKDFKFSPLTFEEKYVEFNFEEGECERLKNYKSTYQINYGNKKLDTGYEFNSDTNELMENLTPSVVSQKRQYSCMMNTEYEDRPNFMGYSYMVYPNEHYVDNDDEGKNAGMSGAFYFRNSTFAPDSRLSHWDTNGNYVVTITDDTQHMIQTQEFCWNSCGEGIVLCYLLPDVSTISRSYRGKRYSVHFESPKEYYFETPSGNINYVYHSFWENYINERYCSQNKKLTAYVYLSIDEFKDIDFREFIKIDNILYHIDKVYDFNFNSDEPVKMDLVQVWNLSAYTDGQDEVPYLFTVPDSVGVTTTNQTVQVYTSYSDYHIGSVPSWITASIDGNGDLTIRANSVASEYRVGYVVLFPGPTASPSDFYKLGYGWNLTVKQYPTPPYRLEVDRNTIVFDLLGGTETVIVDCSDTSNNAINIAVSMSFTHWLRAYIQEYSETMSDARRDCLHLIVVAEPNIATAPRSGTVALSITANGTTYTQVINVGQQGGKKHTRDNNYRIITDIDSDLVVLDSNDTVVNTLISGEVYHFDDLFPEEIDINSIQITGGGSVNITGSVGLQTVEFMPQLSDGDQVGGGLITAATLNGNIVSYAYDVQVQGYTPEPPEPPTPPAPEPSMAETYFFIEDISGAANTLSIAKYTANAPTIEVFYSTDQTNWVSMGTTSTTAIYVTIPANSKLYLKATTDSWCVNYHMNQIIVSANFNVGGNIMSLLYGDNFIGETSFPNGSDSNFYDLFDYDNGYVHLINSKDLVLPATTLTEQCYRELFSQCRDMVSAPELPATTLAKRCYNDMFLDCRKLSKAPVLPATTLADYCYVGMFENCYNLTVAPELPATTLVQGCYYWMFTNCRSLTSTPKLPATILVDYCYGYMFYQCIKLKEVHIAADDISATDCINGWLTTVAPTGNFYNYGSAVYPTDSASGIPQGWTEHNVTPPVPTPDKRRIIVASDENGMFQIAANPSVMEPKTTNYFEDDFVDGTVITLTSVPNNGYTLSYWIDQDNNKYTTPVVTFTVSSSIVDQDNMFNMKLVTKQAQRTYNVEISAGNNGYITVPNDQTQYSVFRKTVLEGTTISDVRVTPNAGYTFQQWDDGSILNPRDFTVYSDVLTKALYTGGSNSRITIDGGGLLGGDDYISLGLNGNEVAKVGIGKVKTITVANGTYDWKLYCHINDIRSTFTEWDIDGVTESSNPYADPAMVISQDKIIKVVCTLNVIPVI